MITVNESTWTAGDVTLSGLEAKPTTDARATILALPGGGYRASYFDNPIDPGASLLRLAALHGYRAVALDRPGYGASFGLVGEAVRAARQAEIVATLIDDWTKQGSIGAGVFLVGHSFGSVLAVHIAAQHPRDALLGMEVAGIPLRFKEELVDRVQLASVDHLPETTWDYRRELFFGPNHTFEARMADAEPTVSALVPAAEIIDAADVPVLMPQLAPLVRIPVQYTVAEFEQSADSDATVLGEAGGLFTSSDRFVPQWQVQSGHDISLHRVARSYHLRILAFLDEILVARQTPRA